MVEEKGDGFDYKGVARGKFLSKRIVLYPKCSGNDTSLYK